MSEKQDFTYEDLVTIIALYDKAFEVVIDTTSDEWASAFCAGFRLAINVDSPE